MDGKEFTSREFIPSEIGGGKHQLTYEMDGLRESLRFVISKSIKPSIAIHHLDFSEKKGWDIAFCNHPILGYPMEWQLEQYQYNDEYKDSSGIFKRYFNPNAGEIGLSLQIHNPSPCHATHTRKKLLFEQLKESLCESKGSFSCSLVRKLPIKTINLSKGIQLEDNIITINKEFTRGKNEILIPLYQENEAEFIFTLVRIQVLNASFKLTCKSGNTHEPENIILNLSPINQDGHSKWEVNGITHQNGQEISLALSQLQKTLSITHIQTFVSTACHESLTVEVKVKEILEGLEGNGSYSKIFSA